MRNGGSPDDDDDLLDGCPVAVEDERDDPETQLLRPLFPDGPTGTSHEAAARWRDLFDHVPLPRLMPGLPKASPGRDLRLADRMRRTPYEVVECAGWTTRGTATLAQKGSVHHHTASPTGSPMPTLGVLLNGRRSPKLAGPLCNIGLSRDNVIYVIASGKANHAGSGGWRGLTCNSSVYGVEWENVGTLAEPARPDQVEAICWVHAELARGQYGPDMCCQHREWAPGRKVDALISGEAFRARVRELLTGPGPLEEEDDMPDGALVRVDGDSVVWCVSAAGRWHVPATHQPGPPANEWTGTIDLLGIMGLVRTVPGAAGNIIVLRRDQRAALEAIPIIGEGPA